MKLNVTINEPLGISGANNYLILEPEQESLYTWDNVGNGTPINVWNNLAIMFTLPNNYVAEGLKGFVQENLELFQALAETYEGTTWDGNNHTGQWNEKCQALEQEIRNALADDAIPTYWEAGDWLYGDIGSCIDECLTHTTIREYAEIETKRAKRDGVYLNVDDVESVMRSCLEEKLDDVQDKKKAAKIRRLIGATND